MGGDDIREEWWATGAAMIIAAMAFILNGLSLVVKLWGLVL